MREMVAYIEIFPESNALRSFGYWAFTDDIKRDKRVDMIRFYGVKYLQEIIRTPAVRDNAKWKL